jgi:hypothetical protein
MDEPTQAEKLAALHNDRLLKRGVAYADVVDLYDDSRPHGRFAIGAQQPLTEYPRQPPNSPWHHDPVGLEPPLGYSVNEMEPVGTPAEVARSVEAATRPSTPTSPCSARPSVSGAASLIRRRC